MRIYTATNKRPDVARLWFTAMRATLTTPATLVEVHVGEPTGLADEALPLQDHGFGNPLYVVRRLLPKEGERMFIEEDIIPVAPWSPDDYPGPLRFLDAHQGAPWPAITIARTTNAFRPFELIPQRFVRDGGCPDWLPAELCQPALNANAKVVGSHFLHIDKLYRQTEYAEQKTALIQVLAKWIECCAFAINETREQFTRQNPPSVLAKVKNFAAAAASHVAAGMPRATDEEVERRYAICQGCEFLKNDACAKCGCPIVRRKKFISKLSWADQKCPIGKW